MTAGVVAPASSGQNWDEWCGALLEEGVEGLVVSDGAGAEQQPRRDLRLEEEQQQRVAPGEGVEKELWCGSRSSWSPVSTAWRSRGMRGGRGKVKAALGIGGLGGGATDEGGFSNGAASGAGGTRSCRSEGKRERPWGSRGSGCRCVCEAGGGREREGGDRERAKLSCGGARGEGRPGARLRRRAQAGPWRPTQ